MKQLLLLCFGFMTSPFFGQVSLVENINASGDANPLRLTIFNSTLFFTANDGVNGRELWKYDGTNTTLFDINTTSNLGSSPTGLFGFQGNLYLSADGGTHGKELWRGDGASFNLFFDINTGTGDSTPNAFVQFNNQLIFSAFQPLPVGREPMVSDGTLANTQLLSNVSPVNNFSSNAEFYTEYNGKLYFSASSSVSGANGVQFYATDGTNSDTQLVKTINSSGDAFPRDYIVFNNLLYFTADNGVNGRELWMSDGMASGTQMVQDLYAGSVDSNPTDFTIYNNRLYFSATHSSLGTELFYVNTSGAIINASNIRPGSASSLPDGLTVFNGKLYFSASDGINGRELWETAGTPLSTIMLKDIESGSGSSSPKGFTEYNGKLYFNASNSTSGEELWVTDGTPSGTLMAADINSGFASQSSPEQFIVFNSELYFVADNGSSGRELFKYKDPTLSITTINNFKVSLFPNPANDSFRINSNQLIDSLSIYTIQGKLIKTFKGNQEYYKIEDLQNGVYFVNIETEKGIETKKLIKK
ncbi:ELWxxDGT repeat protein [Algibacter sp. 2305UL17-15]|uniref:ELWxxDGT repeat protein n=1 Tax=Algibacter sp. 2305UL17-15 TaxID=3231268 RepID=UPI00345757B5